MKHFQALPTRIFQKQNIILIKFSEQLKQFEIYFKLKVYLCFKNIRISTLEVYHHRCWWTMTATCLTLSIKALPLIRVSVYGMFRCVRKKVSD